MALTPSGPIRLAGKIFNPSAPAFSAAKHSVGVITPGQEAMPRALVAAITSGSQLGDTISVPPACCTAFTSSTDRTVPAPICAMPLQALAMAAIDSNGSGEFSGTSIRVIPAAIRAWAAATASGGVMPRRMAMIGRWCMGSVFQLGMKCRQPCKGASGGIQTFGLQTLQSKSAGIKR